MPSADPPTSGFFSLPARIASRLRAGAWLRALRRNATPLSPLDASPLLVIAPHQDDETFGCGGLIALKRQLGASVTVVYLTDGAASRSPDGTRSEEFVQRRRVEALTALEILGVLRESVHFLDGPDGGLNQLEAAQSNLLTNRIASVMADLKPRQVAVTFRHDVHTDHEAAYRIACTAVQQSGLSPELLEFPIWSLWHMRAENGPRAKSSALRQLDILSVREVKLRAVACFKSQLSPSPFGQRGFLPPLLVKRLTGCAEIFFVGQRPPDEPLPR